MNLLFADGHVEFVNMAQATRLINEQARAAQPANPPANPPNNNVPVTPRRVPAGGGL
jgi:hypothetical protein